jgi:serine/threonine protein kinase
VLCLGATLGRGSSGVVYAAHNRINGRPVAVKLPHDRDAAAQRALRREYDVLRTLAHPAIVQALGLCRFEDRYGLVMEALQHRSLLQVVRPHCRAGELPDLARLGQVLLPLIEAIAEMHRRQWVHGDLKPDHIVWNSQGQPCWCDLESAERTGRQPWQRSARRCSGTFAYLAPERIASSQLAPPSDIFSLGRMLAACLSGRLPCWDPQSGPDSCDQRIAQQLPPDTPGWLRGLCAAMLRFEPDERPTASDLLHELRSRWTARPADRPVDVPAVRPTPVAERQPAREVRQQIDYLTSAAPGECPTTLLVSRHIMTPECLEQALVRGAGDEPKLVLSCRADARSAFPMNAFSQVCSQLADWLRALPPPLLDSFRPGSVAHLSSVADDLTAALGPAPRKAVERAEGPAAASPPIETVEAEQPLTVAADQLEAAADELADVLRAVAGQRRLILLIHHIEWLDAASSRCLQRLLAERSDCDVVLVGTYDSKYLLQSNRACARILDGANDPLA